MGSSSTPAPSNNGAFAPLGVFNSKGQRRFHKALGFGSGLGVFEDLEKETACFVFRAFGTTIRKLTVKNEVVGTTASKNFKGFLFPRAKIVYPEGLKLSAVQESPIDKFMFKNKN